MIKMTYASKKFKKKSSGSDVIVWITSFVTVTAMHKDLKKKANRFTLMLSSSEQLSCSFFHYVGKHFLLLLITS
jgi:hypothetical protein